MANSYDDWLVDQEHSFRGWNDKQKRCPECGTPIEQNEFVCSSVCFEATML